MSLSGGGLNKLGSRIQKADIGGFRAQGEANKKMRKERKVAQGREWLTRNPSSGNPIDAIQYWRGRRRTNTLGGSLPEIPGRLGGNTRLGRLANRGTADMRATTDRRLLQTEAAGEDAEYKNAALEHGEAIRRVDHPARQKANLNIVHAQLGDRVSIGNREVVVTEAMQRAAMADALQIRQTQVIDNYIATHTHPDPVTGHPVFEDANFERFSKDNFPALDAQMSDVARGHALAVGPPDPITHAPAAVAIDPNTNLPHRSTLSVAFQNIANARNETDGNGRNRVAEIVNAAEYTAANGGEEGAKYVATMVNNLSKRSDLSTIDPETLRQVGVLFDNHAERVIASGGALRLDISTDPQTGAVIYNSVPSGT